MLLMKSKHYYLYRTRIHISSMLNICMCINMSLRNDSSGFCEVQTAYIYMWNKKYMQKSDVDLDG